MIGHSAFRFGTYQAVAFYANLRLAINKILPRLLSELADVLDADPIALPVPGEAPPEIPRLFLSNKDQSIRMEVSPQRADVRWQRKSPSSEMNLEQFCDFSQRAFVCFHEAAHVMPGRIALVVNRFQPHENPGKALASHFCHPPLLSNEPGKKGPLNRPEQFELHAHKRFEIGSFRVNSWVRCKTGTITEEQKKHPIILVEQDINTLAEGLADTEFSGDDIREFHHLTVKEFETIIRLYFPEGNKQGGK